MRAVPPSARPRSGLDDGVTDFCRDPFAQDHRGDDHDQDHRDLGPGKVEDGGVQLQTDPAGADQAEHRRFADVDVPSKDGDASKCGKDLGNDAKAEDLCP